MAASSNAAISFRDRRGTITHGPRRDSRHLGVHETIVASGLSTSADVIDRSLPADGRITALLLSSGLQASRAWLYSSYPAFSARAHRLSQRSPLGHNVPMSSDGRALPPVALLDLRVAYASPFDCTPEPVRPLITLVMDNPMLT
jgi:hypothetical protein